jgi:hypothetical protein
MDIPISFIWIIILFDAKYGDGAKFWGYVVINAEPLCVEFCNFFAMPYLCKLFNFRRKWMKYKNIIKLRLPEIHLLAVVPTQLKFSRVKDHDEPTVLLFETLFCMWECFNMGTESPTKVMFGQTLVLMQMTFLNNVRKVGRLVLSRTSCLSSFFLFFFFIYWRYQTTISFLVLFWKSGNKSTFYYTYSAISHVIDKCWSPHQKILLYYPNFVFDTNLFSRGPRCLKCGRSMVHKAVRSDWDFSWLHKVGWELLYNYSVIIFNPSSCLSEWRILKPEPD